MGQVQAHQERARNALPKGGGQLEGTPLTLGRTRVTNSIKGDISFVSAFHVEISTQAHLQSCFLPTYGTCSLQQDPVSGGWV